MASTFVTLELTCEPKGWLGDGDEDDQDDAGCNAGGSTGGALGLGLAVLAIVRRRRRPW